MAKVVNYGDDFTEKICLRMSTRQYRYIKQLSDYYNTTPSGYIRKLIDFSIYHGGICENYMSDCNDKLQ